MSEIIVNENEIIVRCGKSIVIQVKDKITSSIDNGPSLIMDSDTLPRIER